ncbi:hypothetical protein FE783_00085 [Paenibacillus mesophilus]|uniref:hypothetical protein n=1 Tax=Paenibacillus mesophilus TaxID=2582849 RepID=UPI00110EEB9D|nr:hypothetical protein [Paenibacillus mesophilus]TMV52633.1 hypothetical protein FE783_00085 [Paenibacillus mesophilus]
MPAMEPYDRIVELAFQKSKLRDQLNDDEANETLRQFYKQIEEWDGSVDRLSFIGDYLVGTHMNKIIAKGMAQASPEGFVRIMTQERTILEKVAELLRLRKSGPVDERLTNRIKDVQLERAVKIHPSLEGPAPDQYIHRFLCCLFMEIMTPVANKSDLKKIARILDIGDANVSFVNLQVRVRGKVEGALQRLQLHEEVNTKDVFRRAVIAYHILEAHKELQAK